MSEEVWSATRIDTANYCMMRYYYKYRDPSRPAPLYISAYAKGVLLHRLIENFWIHLGTTEEVYKDKKSRKKASEKKKYFDAESFAQYAKNKWTSIIIGNSKIKDISRRIYWRDGYENDSEAWEIRAGIEKMTTPLFRELIKEGPPLYSELDFEFRAEGLNFRGFIDEIRLRNGKTVIRDYKSGSPFGIGDMKRDFDPQLTFYNAGLTSLFYSGDEKNRELAKTLGINLEEILKNRSYITPDIIEEFFMIEAPYIIELANTQSPKAPKMSDFAVINDYIEAYGNHRENLGIWKEKRKKFVNLPNITKETRRTEQHFYNLVDNIRNVESSVESGNISFESGKKCDFCDMRHVCSKRACDPISIPKDKKGNMLFSFMDPIYQAKTQGQSTTKSDDKKEEYVQRKFDFRKKEPWRGKLPYKPKQKNPD